MLDLRFNSTDYGFRPLLVSQKAGPSNPLESGFQVGQQVLGILHPHRKAYQSIADPDPGPFLRGN
jgi:hypothetical protein